MQVEKTQEVYIPNFDHQFTGSLRSLCLENNPYIKKAKQLAKEYGIPDFFIQNTEIQVMGDNVKFFFKWRIEVETPKEKKKKVIAFIGDFPTEKEPSKYREVFVQLDSGIYLLYVDYRGLKNDYDVEGAIQLEEKEVVEYIDSLNIDFNKRYLEGLTKLAKDYGYSSKKEHIEKFLTIEKVKRFILEEDGESLSDTSPRETLLDWYETFLHERRNKILDEMEA